MDGQGGPWINTKNNCKGSELFKDPKQHPDGPNGSAHQAWTDQTVHKKWTACPLGLGPPDPGPKVGLTHKGQQPNRLLVHMAQFLAVYPKAGLVF